MEEKLEKKTRHQTGSWEITDETSMQESFTVGWGDREGEGERESTLIF